MSFLSVLNTIEKVCNAATTLQSFAQADKKGKIGIGLDVLNDTVTNHQDTIVKYVKKHKGK